MSAVYTFDVFCSLDGFGSYDEPGDWGGYWGKQGPEFLARRLGYGGETARLTEDIDRHTRTVLELGRLLPGA